MSCNRPQRRTANTDGYLELRREVISQKCWATDSPTGSRAAVWLLLRRQIPRGQEGFLDGDKATAASVVSTRKTNVS